MGYLIDFDIAHTLGDDIGDDTISYTHWLRSGNTFSPCVDTEVLTKLIPGTYTVYQTREGGVEAERCNISTDELYHLPNSVVNDAITEIASFWNKGEKFKTHKVTHKRGILFMGPPGTGKTSLINLLASDLITNGGVVFYINEISELFMYMDFAKKRFRSVEPDRPIITVIEDINKFMDGAGVESALLNFLDGSDSFDHHVVIATTNRLEELNDMLLRPSRFDWLIEVDKPTLEVRESFLVKKGVDPALAVKWAKDTEDYSIAELKELFTSVVLLDIDFDRAKGKIKKQKDDVGTQTFRKKPKKGIGFRFGE